MSFEFKPLTPEELAYLESHRQTTTVPEMAAHLKRGAATLYAWMEEKGYQPYRRPRVPGYHHPLRYSNRKLERTLKHWDIVNGKNGPV